MRKPEADIILRLRSETLSDVRDLIVELEKLTNFVGNYCGIASKQVEKVREVHSNSLARLEEKLQYWIDRKSHELH